MSVSLFQFKKFLIIGSGSSGKGAARLLASLGKQVRISTDGKMSAEDESAYSSLSIDFEVNGHTDVFMQWADVCVISPGVKPDSLVMQKMIQHQKEIVTEIDVASSIFKAKWVAITGSNGKTSTSTLIAAILAPNIHLDLCGNIGKSFSESVLESLDCFKVVELSSFQLKYSKLIQPYASILLNLSPNHLNWHYDLQDYYESKLSLLQRTQPDGFILLNYDDLELRHRVKRSASRLIWFSLSSEKADYYLKQGRLLHNINGEYEDTGISLPSSNLPMPLSNFLAATVCGLEMKVPVPSIDSANKAFMPLKHRIQTIATFNDIRFVNDSKSTTEASTIQALQACGKEVILLAGGVMKVTHFDALERIIDSHVTQLIVFGSGAEALYKIFSDKVVTSRKSTLREAFMEACRVARAGQTILLSPMCASFDQFKSFEERGDLFIQIVQEYMATPLCP